MDNRSNLKVSVRNNRTRKVRRFYGAPLAQPVVNTFDPSTKTWVKIGKVQAKK